METELLGPCSYNILADPDYRRVFAYAPCNSANWKEFLYSSGANDLGKDLAQQNFTKFALNAIYFSPHDMNFTDELNSPDSLQAVL